MKIISWNMAAGFGFDAGRHARAWDWLIGQEPDAALLQEVVVPDELAPAWDLVAHTRKYSRSDVAWGSAVLVRNKGQYRPHPLAKGSWLAGLAGAVCVAEPLEPERPWLVSLHSNAYPIPAETLATRDLTGVRACKPGELWEIEAAAHELGPLLRGRRFLAGGDLNSALLFDDVYRNSWNSILFANLREAGFIDLRERHLPTEQRTYFKAGKGPYQLDHVFGDPTTESHVKSWRVATQVAEQYDLSDHAAILIEIRE
jgi:exonuclease III